MSKYIQKPRKYDLHNGQEWEEPVFRSKRGLQSWFYYGGNGGIRLLKPQLIKEVDVIDSERSGVIRSFGR